MKLAFLLVVGVIARQAYGDQLKAIVGGNFAYTGQFPFQAGLVINGGIFCGGSIIDKSHILTAAHCVDDVNVHQYLEVRTGALKSKNDGESHQIKNIRVHPGYTGKRRDRWKDDIAVITLTEPITFNDIQKAIPLASRNYADGQQRGIISGWGKTKVISFRVPPYLMWAEVGVLSQTDCLAAHPKSWLGGAFTNPKHICTLKRRGIGACQGDSGSLVINGELCGITSWVAPCARGVADVFTNVYYYLDFIEECRAQD